MFCCACPDPRLDKKMFIDKCHSVYCADAPTDENPRLSVFFKWRETKFTQVLDVYNQFVKFKINQNHS